MEEYAALHFEGKMPPMNNLLLVILIWLLFAYWRCGKLAGKKGAQSRKGDLVGIVKVLLNPNPSPD
jgi:hypothetical protein